MSDLSNEEIEGRLIAHREALSMMLALVARHASEPDRVWALLEEQLQPQTHQEDPGALPSRAFAIEAAAMREFQLLVQDARSRNEEESFQG